jgi:hypothetical protein
LRGPASQLRENGWRCLAPHNSKRL